MNQEQLLKIFYKYGFYSLKKEPFLYVGNEGVGISYSFKDELYGSLTRVFIPENTLAAEDFLAKYSWYKANARAYGVTIKLDSYKIKNPKVSFVYQNQSLSFEDMKSLAQGNTNFQMSEEDINYIKKLHKTIHTLVSVLEEKIKVQKDTYNRLVEFTNDYIDKQNQFGEMLALYKKQKANKLDLIVLSDIPQISFLEFHRRVEETQELDLLKGFIKDLVNTIKGLEVDEAFLKNKYELIRLPLQIKSLKEKQEFLEQYIQKKKGIFTKKENLDDSFLEIDKNSGLSNIVSLESFIANEKKRIEEKYAVIFDLDIRTIGDYFIEFDNLVIDEVAYESLFTAKSNYSKQDVLEHLNSSFLKRTREEQDLLIELQYICKNVVLGDPKSIETFIHLIHNPDNIMIKVKYFKYIDTSSASNCKSSIERELQKFSNLTPDNLLDSIQVFFRDDKDITASSIIKASDNRFSAPVQNDKYLVMYLANLMKDTSIYYVPCEIVSDMRQDDTLVLHEDKPFFFIDLEKNELNFKNSDIIEVVDFVCEEKHANNIIFMTDLSRKKTNYYKEVVIERK